MQGYSLVQKSVQIITGIPRVPDNDVIIIPQAQANKLCLEALEIIEECLDYSMISNHGEILNIKKNFLRQLFV